MTVDLRTCVRNKIEKERRQAKNKDLINFWSNILKQSKVCGKNQNSSDQSIWDALVNSYRNFYKNPNANADFLDAIETFFTPEFIQDTANYYKKVENEQLKIKIRAVRVIPKEFYFRHSLAIPEDTTMQPNIYFIERGNVNDKVEL